MQIKAGSKTRMLMLVVDDGPFQDVVVLEPVVRCYQYGAYIPKFDALRLAAEDTMMHALAKGSFAHNQSAVPWFFGDLKAQAEEMLANPQMGCGSVAAAYQVEFYTDANQQLAARLA
jgi:hypothetical protein